MFFCNGGFAHALPLMNLQQTFNLLLWNGVSIKHTESLFMWSPSRSSAEDADSHIKTLMCFKVAIEDKAEL